MFLAISVLVWLKQKPRIFPAGLCCGFYFFRLTAALPPVLVPLCLLVFRVQRYCLLEEPRSIFSHVLVTIGWGSYSSAHSTSMSCGHHSYRLALSSATLALGSVRNRAVWRESLNRDGVSQLPGVCKGVAGGERLGWVTLKLAGPGLGRSWGQSSLR